MRAGGPEKRQLFPITTTATENPIPPSPGGRGRMWKKWREAVPDQRNCRSCWWQSEGGCRNHARAAQKCRQIYGPVTPERQYGWPWASPEMGPLSSCHPSRTEREMLLRLVKKKTTQNQNTGVSASRPFKEPWLFSGRGFALAAA